MSYYKGEKIVIRGKLIDNDSVSTNMTLKLRIIHCDSSNTSTDIAFTKSTDGIYSAIIDTNQHYGRLLLRFVLVSNDSEDSTIIVSHKDTYITVNTQ